MRWLIDWFQGYDSLQFLAVIFLYVQVACALVGSLGALYTGALLANLAIALFALVAVESGSQTLGRTYAALLACALLLDIIWFILFSCEIRHFGKSQPIGKLAIFSLQLVLWAEIVGFSVRALSAVVWFQMYRLGPSGDSDSPYHRLEAGSVDSTPVSTPTSVRQTSVSDEVLGGSIYDPTYYASLFRFEVPCSSSKDLPAGLGSNNPGILSSSVQRSINGTTC